jgi:drug/metabolite transporter (DMT)-like permease
MLALLALLWGVAFVGIKEVLRELSPSTLTILRFAVADLCLLAVMALSPAARPRFARGDVARLVVLGLCGVPGYRLALNWGEQRTSASVAALIVATAPVMVALLSAAVLRERQTLRRWTGIGLAFAGVAMLSAGYRSHGVSTSVAGALVALIAPLSWAVYTIVAKPLTQRASPIQVTAAGMLIGTVALAPFVGGSTVREIGHLSAGGWTWMLLLGAGSSVAGYLIFVWALGKMPATKVAVFLYPVPVVALLTSWLVLDEPLGWRVLLAAVMVIAGVVLAQQDRGENAAPSPARPVEEPVTGT